MFGVAAGSLAAALMVTQVMDFPFVFVPAQAAVAALGALMVTVVVGFAGTFSALGANPRQFSGICKLSAIINAR